MKHLKSVIFALAACFVAFSCDNDEPEKGNAGTDAALQGVIYVLNNGNWGSNDANVLLYDLATGTAAPDFFYTTNKQHLGDLGQDIALVGNEYYIAVNGSQVIFVTDYNMKVKRQIVAEADGAKLSPRCFAVGGGHVYVTYYEGYLGEIDPADYSVRTTPVGSNPEGVAYADGVIYVANSGGANYPDYDNTISVVDAAKFCEERRYEVNLNPQNIVASPNGTMLYVNSFGNYGDIPAKLQTLSTTSGEVKDLPYDNVKAICAGKGGVLYVATGDYDENYQVTARLYCHDMQRDESKGLFCDDVISSFYSLSYSNGLVFVGQSDYQTNGDVSVYDESGKRLLKLDAQGLNPQKCVKL